MPAHRGAPGRSVGARDSPVDDAVRPAPGRVEYSTTSGQRPDADAAVGEGIGVVPILEARPEVVVPANLGAVAVYVEDPVPPAGLEGHVVHHRQLRRADHEELELGHGGVRQRLIERAVGHADGLAPVAVLALVPRVVSAEADLPGGERSLVDVDALGLRRKSDRPATMAGLLVFPRVSAPLVDARPNQGVTIAPHDEFYGS